MTVNLNTKGYEVLRESSPVAEWYAELQKTDGSAALPRFALGPARTSAVGENPMVFSLPVAGGDVTLPCEITQVRLYESSGSTDPLTDAEAVAPLLLVLEADQGTVTLTITLPAEA